jgi:hypothetical protein
MSDEPVEVDGEPVQTDNEVRPEDGEQDVSQDPNDEYTDEGVAE